MVRIRHRRPYGCPAPGPNYALRAGIVGLGLPPDRLRSLGPRHLGFDRSYCALALGSAHSVGPRHLANDRSYCAFPWVALNFRLSNWSPLNVFAVPAKLRITVLQMFLSPFPSEGRTKGLGVPLAEDARKRQSKTPTLGEE